MIFAILVFLLVTSLEYIKWLSQLDCDCIWFRTHWLWMTGKRFFLPGHMLGLGLQHKLAQQLAPKIPEILQEWCHICNIRRVKGTNCARSPPGAGPELPITPSWIHSRSGFQVQSCQEKHEHNDLKRLFNLNHSNTNNGLAKLEGILPLPNRTRSSATARGLLLLALLALTRCCKLETWKRAMATLAPFQRFHKSNHTGEPTSHSQLNLNICFLQYFARQNTLLKAVHSLIGMLRASLLRDQMFRFPHANRTLLLVGREEPNLEPAVPVVITKLSRACDQCPVALKEMPRIYDTSSISLSWLQPFSNAGVLVLLSLLKQVNVQSPLSTSCPSCCLGSTLYLCLPSYFIVHSSKFPVSKSPPCMSGFASSCSIGHAKYGNHFSKTKMTRKYQEKILYQPKHSTNSCKGSRNPGLVSHQMALLGRGVALRMRSHDKARRQSLARGEPLALRVVQAA